jgi:protein-disulfide isomerase
MLKLLRATAIVASMAALVPGAATAADPVFSTAQRDEIVRIVREALKNDPSILRDAVATLNVDNEAQEAATQRASLEAHRQELVSKFGDPQSGNPSGDVTVIEFYDPRCPYCRKMLANIDTLLEKDHGIRLVYKDIPVLGPASTMEARAILAAQLQGGYRKMQTALMSDPAQPTAGMLSDVAKELGLNPAKLASDMDSPATTQRINANLALARALKITGTPTFVVGDTIIPGMVDLDQLQEAVASARKHAG